MLGPFLNYQFVLSENIFNNLAILYTDDMVPPTFDRLTSSQVLPWGAPKERSRFPSSFNIETDIRPGEFVMRTLLAEFTVQVRFH